MTEKHEKAERAAIMRERGCSELEESLLVLPFSADDGNAHSLFLKQRHTKGAFKNIFQSLRRILDHFVAAPAA